MPKALREPEAPARTPAGERMLPSWVARRPETIAILVSLLGLFVQVVGYSRGWAGEEHVPIALVGGLPATLKRLRDAGIWVVGLDDAADRSLFDLGDLATEGICLVLGAEGAGLSRLVRERCDAVVSIPMRGRIGSLNVSAAAALATYEVARHRV